MSTTNTISKSHENEKLNKFFTDVIDEATMAKHIRRLNYLLTQAVIQEDETRNVFNREWLDSGFYYLNELAEILDPYLDVE
ncbi:MAG: hypothetical protein ABI850_17420 [Flavobacterium sp.]